MEKGRVVQNKALYEEKGKIIEDLTQSHSSSYVVYMSSKNNVRAGGTDSIEKNKTG